MGYNEYVFYVMLMLCDAHVQKSHKYVKLCVITLENANMFIIKYE